MRTLIITGSIIRIDDIRNDYKTIRAAVDGRIETTTLRDNGVMITDAEGMEKGKPYNSLASLVAGTSIFGVALIVGTDGEEFTDVPEHYFPLLSCGEV